MREEKNATIPVSGPTPLDEIRHVEARVASQLIQAQKEALARKQAAKKQADLMERQARLDGAQAGQADCEKQVSEIKRQAEEIVADAKAQAASLASQGQDQIREAVHRSIRFVLGVDVKDWRHDS